MHIDAAAELFEQVVERPWKFSSCARILHECPKYKPKHEPKKVPEEGEEAEEGKPKAVANPIASIQGKGLAVPIGTKKAKKQALAAKLDLDSQASTAQTDAMLAVAKASADLTEEFKKKRTIDSMHKSVQAYIKLGMVDKAAAKLAEIEELDEEDRKPAALPSLPTAKEAVPEEVNMEEQEEDEE